MRIKRSGQNLKYLGHLIERIPIAGLGGQRKKSRMWLSGLGT